MTTERKNIFIAGHKGMVGSAIIRELKNIDEKNILTKDKTDLDLMNQKDTYEFLKTNKFKYVIIAAAKVGGIIGNKTFPAEYIFNNLTIQNNLIHGSYLSGVEKVLFLGSSCIYPKFAKQPITEDQLLNGYLEPTNEPYALAKIAGIKLCTSYNQQYNTDYRSIMPTNLYGFNDNFNSENSHVIPSLLRRFNQAKEKNYKQVVIWGTGKPRREFLFVDDLAKACLKILKIDKKNYNHHVSSHVNIGTGEDISIKELSYLIAKIIGFKGKIIFDTQKPDGTPRKVLNVGLINRLGWKAKTKLEDGLNETFIWMKNNIKNLRI